MLNPSFSSRGQQPPTPTSARSSAQRHKAPMSATPTSSQSSFREPHVSERRSSRSAMRETPFMSIPRSQRGGAELETPTRSRTAVSSSARRTAMDLTALQTQGNAMKVYVRVRPFSERELAQASSTHSTIRIDAENPSMITVLEPSRDFRPLVTYQFTRCFWSVFERSADSSDLQKNKTMNDMRETVDVYLNGGMNSTRRARAQSLVSQEKLLSARGGPGKNGKDGPTEVPPAYLGSGSNAAMVDANVSHPPYASQADVYEHVGKPVLENTVDGYNGCVFAYGQTGSGKTFTMLGYAPQPAEFRRRRESMPPLSGRNTDVNGNEDAVSGGTTPRRGAGAMDMASFHSQSGAFDRMESAHVINMEDDTGDDVVDKAGLDPIELMGIIPRICTDMFSALRGKREKDPSWSYRVEVTYYEIYNEKVYDLIKSSRNAELKIRNHPTNGPYVDGLASKTCMKEEEVLRVIRNGMEERHTAQTKFNDRSSRSHAILAFSLLQLALDGSDNTVKVQSKLNLVDLAGSERAGAAGVDRPEYKEGVNINLSLTVLGRVIDCLADLSQNKSLAVPVPYRDSTLTLLLMDSIGGNSQTSMVATVSPHMLNFEEVKQTLRYASRAKQIVNRAVRNEDPQVRQIKLLTGEVERLQQLLKEAGGCDYTNEDIRAMEKKIKMLEKRVAEQDRIIACLRAELERAGIADPTLDESFAEGKLDIKTPQQRRQEEQLAKRYEAMQAELIQAKAEFERKQKGDLDHIATLKKRVAEQEKQMQKLQVDAKAARTLGLLYTDRAENDLTNIFSYIEEKENSFFQNCWAVLQSQNNDVGTIIAQVKRDQAEALRTAEQKHDEELKAAQDNVQARVKEANEAAQQQQQRLIAKHKEALASIEEHMQKNREIHDAELKQLQEEKEQLRRLASDASAKAREQYQQDLEKLKQKLESAESERRTGPDAKTLQDQHTREMDRLNDELERTRQAKEKEIGKIRTQLENEQLRRESDLMEKDRQRRQVDIELSETRRKLMEAQSDQSRSEREYQDQIRDLVRQQEELINISNSVLGDWENKSSDMEGQMCKLRALIYDKDYMNFRQKMRELAFAERTDITKEMADVEEKRQRDAMTLRNIKNKVQRTLEEQDGSLEKYRKQYQQRLAAQGRTPRGESRTPTSAGSASPTSPFTPSAAAAAASASANGSPTGSVTRKAAPVKPGNAKAAPSGSASDATSSQSSPVDNGSNGKLPKEKARLSGPPTPKATPA